MNTPRDTDEGRARPSVWPVYVAAAVIVAVGVWVIYPLIGPYVFFRPRTEWVDLLRSPLGLVVAWVLLGFVAAVGLVGLRSWAWWCAVIFTAGWALEGASAVLDRIVVSFHRPDIQPSTEVIRFATAWLVVLALMLVPLVARRQLFFPPKPEREE